jgi:hypothetical protein
MDVLLSPQIGLDSDNFSYVIDSDRITAGYKGVTDTFDLSGVMDTLDVSQLETTLQYQPIISAKRVNGTLRVELLNFISEEASPQEAFPQWQVL